MTVNLCAFEDLVDVAKPGDRMEVTGIYRAQAMRVKPTQKTLKSVYRTYIDVIHFKRTEKGRLGERGCDSDMGRLSFCRPSSLCPPRRRRRLLLFPPLCHQTCRQRGLVSLHLHCVTV